MTLIVHVQRPLVNAAAGVEGKFLAFRKGVHTIRQFANHDIYLCSCWHAVCTGPSVAEGSSDGPEQCTTKRQIVGCKFSFESEFHECTNLEGRGVFAWESILS